ncbi:MAG: hypothetical protein AAF664_16225, partial [Planctomycetota bacterium]
MIGLKGKTPDAQKSPREVAEGPIFSSQPPHLSRRKWLKLAGVPTLTAFGAAVDSQAIAQSRASKTLDRPLTRRWNLACPHIQDSPGADVLADRLGQKWPVRSLAGLFPEATLKTWERFLDECSKMTSSGKHPDPVLAELLGLELAKPQRDLNDLPTPVRSLVSQRRIRARPKRWSTSRFDLYSFASTSATRNIATVVEETHRAWCELFFPFWNQSQLVENHFSATQSRRLQGRPNLRRQQKFKIVVFANANQYQDALSADVPNASQSTGFYHDASDATYLYPAEETKTLRHEVTHQLFRRATSAPTSNDFVPGRAEDFWIVEGIAGYFESLRSVEQSLVIGGWDSDRLQYARYRVLAGGDQYALESLRKDGRDEAQQLKDLARWYAHAIMRTHQAMDGRDEDRRWFYRTLARVYRLEDQLIRSNAPEPPPEGGVEDFLQVDDNLAQTNPITPEQRSLCLCGCSISDTSLSQFHSLPNLQWLDLSRIQTVNLQTVINLVADPKSLTQLTLDGTPIADFDAESFAIWVSSLRNLEQLDLSWLGIDDGVVRAMAGLTRLRTLWLTGCPISDDSVGTLAR